VGEENLNLESRP